MKIIYYVHGANSSPQSFAYIEQFIDVGVEDKAIFFKHSMEETLEEIVGRMHKDLATLHEYDVHIVAHSIGGVIAVAAVDMLLDAGHIKTIATMSTPFAGSKAASRARLAAPFNQFLINASANNLVTHRACAAFLDVSVMNIVTTGGRSSLIHELNDGVVTYASQLARYDEHNEDTLLREIELNHFEVLLSRAAATFIQWHIEQFSEPSA